MSVDADAEMGAVLRALRVEAGLTLEAAARELRMGQHTLLHLEDGDAPVYFTDLLEIVALYGTDTGSFLLRVAARLERARRRTERG